jgi:hypothetical protein
MRNHIENQKPKSGKTVIKLIYVKYKKEKDVSKLETSFFL